MSAGDKVGEQASGNARGFQHMVGATKKAEQEGGAEGDMGQAGWAEQVTLS